MKPTLAYFFLIISLALVLNSCDKDRQLGEKNLSTYAKQFMPLGNSLEFTNSNQFDFNLTLQNNNNYYENIATGSDSYGLGIETYYAEHERWEKSYSGDGLRIDYKLLVPPAILSTRDILSISIVGGQENIDIKLDFEKERTNKRWPDMEKRNQILLDTSSFTDVLMHEKEGNKFYFQEGMGLIGFTIDSVDWHL